jgi:hypothetical protein
MAKSTTTSNGKTKKAAKKALSKLMQADREVFREVVLEAIEDFVLGELVLEGRKSTKLVPRSEIFKILEGEE